MQIEKIIFRTILQKPPANELSLGILFPISNIFSTLCIESLSDYLFHKRTYIYLILLCLNIIVFSLCLNNTICYRKKIIYYLRISRCILKIIPTSIISSTPELELWIEENKN